MCTKWIEPAHKLMTVIEGDFSLICLFFFKRGEYMYVLVFVQL